MEGLVLNKRYAKVLFDLALEQNQLDQVFSDMELVKKVCRENDEFCSVLKSRVIHNDIKEKIIKEVFHVKVSELTMQFVLFIVRKGRGAALTGVTLLFLDMVKTFKNIKTAIVFTAEQANAAMNEKIKNLLEAYTGKTVEIENRVDKKILGGFRIYFDDCLYDAALSTKLKKLNKSFSVNVYEKLF